MKDLTPWSKTGATAFERQLLDAAKRDRAPDALKLRMAAGLAVLPPMAAAGGAAGTSGTGAGAASAHGSGVGGLVFSPPVLWGSLSAIILAGALGWQQFTSSSAPAPKNTATNTTNTTNTAPLAVSAPAPQPAPAPVADPEPSAAVTPAAVSAPAALPALAASAPRVPQAAPATRLREELALLDAARSALAARESERALKLLERHAAQYARGHLAPEADALRIDAYVQRGATARAEKLSQRFLERYPSHPLAAHIATVAQ